MAIDIVYKDAFDVAGISITTNPGAPEIRGAWERLFNEGLFEKLFAQQDGPSLGVCYGMLQDGRFNYMAGAQISNPGYLDGLDVSVLHVEPAEYYIHTCHGRVPDGILQGWKDAMEILGQEGYRHSGAPDFEHYPDGNTDDPDYTMELWIPVIRNA